MPTRQKVQSDGILDKLKFIIGVRGDLQNKQMIGYTCYPTASMMALNYYLADYFKYK